MKGDVYLGMDISSKEEVAIKLEHVDAEYPQLQSEARTYRCLAGGTNIPTLRWFGTEDDYFAIALDRLGLSLEDLLDQCNGSFSLRTVLLLADQLV
jgi:casein kinase I family protein HRR25